MISDSPVLGAPVLARLADLDRRVAVAGPPLTLAPGRRRATPLVELVERLLRPDAKLPDGVPQAFAEAMAGIVEAQLRAFPQNLFWDVDFLAASILRAALAGAEPAAHLHEAAELIASLQDLFGHGTAIRFRYVHDFVYGFDWAKWVRRGPDERADIGPFDLPFLRYTRARGAELLALIAQDDAKYHQLRDEAHRNPFAFSREPEDESRLFADLADQDLLPVRAFCTRAQPVWDRPFAELREQRARALGLTPP